MLTRSTISATSLRTIMSPSSSCGDIAHPVDVTDDGLTAC